MFAFKHSITPSVGMLFARHESTDGTALLLPFAPSVGRKLHIADNIRDCVLTAVDNLIAATAQNGSQERHTLLTDKQKYVSVLAHHNTIAEKRPNEPLEDTYFGWFLRSRYMKRSVVNVFFLRHGLHVLYFSLTKMWRSAQLIESYL